MTTIDEIIEFLKEFAGREKIDPNADLFYDIGIYGDDFHEMIEKYSKKYSVDMTNYLWYFHSDEEGQSIGENFFKPPYERVKRIPISPRLLTEFANKGKWEINYPEHEIPKKRYDILINQILVGIFILVTIMISIKKCST